MQIFVKTRELPSFHSPTTQAIAIALAIPSNFAHRHRD